MNKKAITKSVLAIIFCVTLVSLVFYSVSVLATTTITLGTNPVDNYNDSDGAVTFDFKCSTNATPAYIRLFGDWSGTWVANYTNTSYVNDTWMNISVTGIPAGNGFKWGIFCNDSNSYNLFGANRTLNVDLTAPTIALPAYTNATMKKSSNQLTLNVSLTDAGAGLVGSHCLFNINGTNETVVASNGWCNSSTLSLIGLSGGNNIIKVYANNTVNLFGLNNSYVVLIDDTNPTASFGGPVDTYNTSGNYITFNLSCSDNVNVSALELWTTYSGSWARLALNSSPWNNTPYIYNYTTLDDGTYTWGVYCNDTAGNSNWTTNRTVRVDTTAPTIALPVYTNLTVKKNSSQLTLNVSLTDPDLVGSHCLFNINGTNETVVASNGWCNSSVLNLTGLSEGNNIIKVYANDTFNHVGLNNSYVVLIDDTVANYSNNSTNSTYAGQEIKHRLYWIDSNALGGYIFSFDNGTGTFTNDSYEIMTGAANWSNVTKFVNTTAGSTIQWMVYTSDSAGNLNVSDTYSYILTTERKDTPGGEGSGGTVQGGGSTIPNAEQPAGSIDLGELTITGKEITSGKGASIGFTFNEESHTMKVLELSAFKIKLLISSTPFEVVINAKETKGIDLDLDGVNDMEITFIGLSSDGKAIMNVKTLTTETCGDNACSAGETKEACCNDCGCNAGYACESNSCNAIKEKDASSTWVWIIVLALVVAIIVVLIFSSATKKSRK